MKEELISFETAVLAKEKGFDWKTLNRYQDGEIVGSAWYNHNNPEEQKLWSVELYSAPTQSLLQKWLREKHGINVIPNTDDTLSWLYTIQSLHPQASYVGDFIISIYRYSTLEQALEEGLKEALKLI